jgi:hypothetical protein
MGYQMAWSPLKAEVLNEMTRTCCSTSDAIDPEKGFGQSFHKLALLSVYQRLSDSEKRERRLSPAKVRYSCLLNGSNPTNQNNGTKTNRWK